MLFGFCGEMPPDRAAILGDEMGDVLTVHDRQRFHVWSPPGLVIGQFELPPLADGKRHGAIRVDEGPYSLWMAGEAFSWRDGELADPAHSADPGFRRQLLRALINRGERVLEGLDGEYQIALWDGATRRLRLWTDRFGALPLYWAHLRSGVAFAGGVRGLLVAPAMSDEPDADSIRDAVSFGGYRLGDRTNLRAARMAPPAASFSIASGECQVRRYWTWDRLAGPSAPFSETDALTSMRSAWATAISRRLSESERPGLTLSGGLDSRAILAEATRSRGNLRALTYGVEGCDDVRFATRAARAAGATLDVHRLYGPGWFERRVARIHETDGLMELADLMHLEAVDSLPHLFDVYLSGYVGDVVSGSTYDKVVDADSLLGALPYYGGRLALPFEQGRSRAEELVAATNGKPRFAMFDHKLPQAISRITLAARPYVRVRRPFVDYLFFEGAQRLPDAERHAHSWHERWLLSSYPEYFRRIPNQRTGSPIGVSSGRRQATRVTRYVWRRTAALLNRASLPVPVPVRSFHVDEPHWQSPAIRSELEQTIMRNGSICCEVFGRAAVEATLEDFFSRGQAPLQAIGALFVYEHYHASLTKHVADARARSRRAMC